MNEEELKNSVEHHRAHPEIGIDEHVRNRTVALGGVVNGRERIYLDKRFWIILRDVVLKRRKDQTSFDLLEALRARVRSKRSICPISESVFIELLKQQDIQTRRETAALIDDLSEGVTLAPYPERVSTEIAHFFYDCGGKSELYPLKNLVWSKLGYVLGVQHPSQTPFEASEELVIQKAFFDHMWECSLTEMVDLIGADPPPPMDFDSLAQRLNKDSALHADEIRSFKQAYRTEMTGGLSVFMPVARKVLEQMFERATGKSVEATEAERSEHERKLLSFFNKPFEKDKVAIRLRTLHITSLCHAAYRWDKKRKFEGNDLHDFHHAAAGVGYCNVFLTEKPLRSLLQQNHLRIAETFSCKIISSVKEATKFMSES